MAHTKYYAVQRLDKNDSEIDFLIDKDIDMSGVRCSFSGDIKRGYWFNSEGDANNMAELIERLYSTIGEHSFEFSVIEITIDDQNE